jgi:hypothetical protein
MKNLLFKVALKYGLILAGINLLLGLIATFTFNPENITQSLNVFNILNIIIAWLSLIICLGLAHLEFNRKNNHYMSFGNAIIIGLIVLGITFVISTVYSTINYAFVIKERVKEQLSGSTSGEVILLTLAVQFLYLILQIMLLFIIITAESQWKIFIKAGKKGWASIIPVYNTIVLLEITEKPVWWFFLLLIPLVNIVIAIMIINSLSKSFGKDEGFTAGLIFLPFVFYPLLGLSKVEYIKADSIHPLPA